MKVKIKISGKLKAFLAPVLLFIALLFGGAYFYHMIEGWEYVDALYFTVITVATVGYGDFHPTTQIGKIMTILFVFIGISLAFYFFSLLGRYILRSQLRREIQTRGDTKKGKGVIKI